MSVQVDDRIEVVCAESRDLLVDARAEPVHVHDHPAHVVNPLEAIGRLDRTTGSRRCREEDARLPDRLAEDGRETVGCPGREAWTERQPLNDHHDRRDVAVPASDPPAGSLDLGLVDVREGVRGHQTIPFEKRARLVGRRVSVALDLWKRRCRGHRSPLLRVWTKRASAGRM